MGRSRRDDRLIEDLRDVADDLSDAAHRWRELALLNARLASEWRGRFELLYTALDDEARDEAEAWLRTFDWIVARPEVADAG